MSWITITFSMLASACLTLAAIHFLIWCRNRSARASLLFSLTAVATAALTACEFWMMRAETTLQFGTAVRWLHVAAWAVTLSLVFFVYVHLRAGRLWLAWTFCAIRTLSLLINFLVGQNLNFREVTGLRHIFFLGESVSVGQGPPNPWMLLGQLGLALWLAFIADAAVTVWRRGDKQPALAVAVTIFFFALSSTVQAVLVFWQIIDSPLTTGYFYMGIIAAMGYDITRDSLRAARLSDDLRESEARMTLAAEAAGLGVWMWTIATNRVWGSERWHRMFGFETGADVDYKMVIQRIHPEDRERVESEVRLALETGTDFSSEYRTSFTDGSACWIAARGRRYPDAQGRPARMMGTAIDITGRKQSEQEIARQSNELAHASRISTMGQLASSLAHELSQPLGAILRNADAAELFLQDPSPDLDELRAIVADIRKDDQRAGEVIDRMRNFMKKRKAERHHLDINLLVSDVAAMVRHNGEKSRVRLVLETDPVLPPVHGDRVQLQQVLLNLLLNAMDALNENTPASRLITVRTRPAGAMIEVAVSDTGHGIPEERLSRLFQPFFSSKANGLGMGLAISRDIIEAHHGRLRAENNAGSGATFTVTLPAAKGEDPT